jgi:hypothetical protein
LKISKLFVFLYHIIHGKKQISDEIGRIQGINSQKLEKARKITKSLKVLLP